MTITAASADLAANGAPPVWAPGQTDTVTAVLSRAVEQSPDKAFLDFAGEATYTYSQIWDLSLRRAAGLDRLGVGPGHTVVCILDNNVDAIVSWFAANFLGAVWVPVNTALKGEYLRHQIGDAAAAVVLAESCYPQRVSDIAPDLPDLEHLVVRGPLPESSVCSVTSLDAITPERGRAEPVAVTARDLAMLIYTSGTTGPSKGCMISHNYICNVARNTAVMRNPAFTLWTPLPLFHLNAAGTSVLATAVNQTTVSIAERFSLSRFWPEIKRSGAQQVSILGIMITLIATMPDTPEDGGVFRADRTRGRRTVDSGTDRHLEATVRCGKRRKFGLRTHRGVVHHEQPAGSHGTAGCLGAPQRRLRCPHRRRQRRRGSARRPARSSFARADRTSCSRGTGVGPKRPWPCCATCGSIPATSDGSTKTGGSGSSTARRTICGDAAKTSPLRA